ncbi:adenylosuccinate lyase family protein [Streptomyces sp. NPDC047017]|uniref:class-II fumarase/aspartase family protein n=1 Tax=Streptomyces sp. NPDC047017 TaxID=3155024 RepID=UPI00340982B2
MPPANHTTPHDPAPTDLTDLTGPANGSANGSGGPDGSAGTGTSGTDALGAGTPGTGTPASDASDASDTPTPDTGLLSPVRAGGEEALSDEAWVAAMLDVEVALARAQARLGVVPRWALEPIEAAVRSRPVDVARLARRARGSANPVVDLVRTLMDAVAAQDRDAAEFVHRGGTSQDILDSAAMLLAARSLDRVDAGLGRTADALAALAARHAATPMAGRTLTQHAVPVTFGLKAAGWLTLVLDASDRVRRVRARLPVQLGGAAGTLAAYQEYARLAGIGTAGHAAALTAAFAAELGLRAPEAPWHTARTPLADLGWAATAVTGGLGKFAVDVLGMARTEVDEVAEPGPEGSGASSAMPQKRNPVLATLIVSAARQAPAYSLVLAQSLLAEDERSAGGWQSEWQPLRELLRLAEGAAGTAADLAGGLEIHPDRMRDNLRLTGGAVVSERLNAVLAEPLGKAAAKRLLAEVAREAVTGRRPFDEVLAKTPGLESRLTGGTKLPELLDPANYLGAAEELVERVLHRHRTRATSNAEE